MIAFGILFGIGFMILGWFTARAEAEYDRVAARARESLAKDAGLVEFLANRTK